MTHEEQLERIMSLRKAFRAECWPKISETLTEFSREHNISDDEAGFLALEPAVWLQEVVGQYVVAAIAPEMRTTAFLALTKGLAGQLGLTVETGEGEGPPN